MMCASSYYPRKEDTPDKIFNEMILVPYSSPGYRMLVAHLDPEGALKEQLYGLECISLKLGSGVVVEDEKIQERSSHHDEHVFSKQEYARQLLEYWYENSEWRAVRCRAAHYLNKLNDDKINSWIDELGEQIAELNDSDHKINYEIGIIDFKNADIGKWCRDLSSNEERRQMALTDIETLYGELCSKEQRKKISSILGKSECDFLVDEYSHFSQSLSPKELSTILSNEEGKKILTHKDLARIYCDVSLDRAVRMNAAEYLGYSKLKIWEDDHPMIRSSAVIASASAAAGSLVHIISKLCE
jgi:arsenate reductase-like glutaredoxin family protein